MSHARIAAFFVIAASAGLGSAVAAPAGVDAEMTATLARPLFAPDRRPEAQAVVAAIPDGAASVPRLTGILVDGARRRAIFAVPAQPGGTETVQEGGAIGAYRVQTISLAAVTVHGPSGVLTLTPRYASGLATPAPPSLPSRPTLEPALARPTGPERFAQPVGPMGLAMYRYSPDAPHAPPPVPDALVEP